MKTIGVKEDPRIHYSRVSDVLYLLFDEARHDELGELMSAINLDYDDNGQLIGVEVVNASQLLKEFIKKSNASISVL